MYIIIVMHLLRTDQVLGDITGTGTDQTREVQQVRGVRLGQQAPPGAL